MAIKGGQILHVAGAGFIVDRIQTGGITGINVNEERIEELGNYEAIGTVRDIPDLTYEIESYDVTTELESIITGGDNTEPDTTVFNLANFVPLDILSPYKTSGVYTIDTGSVAIPFLSLESMSYSFGLTDPATMTASFRGDSVFYIPGAAYRETFDGTGAQTTFSFANTALKSTIAGSDYYALSVTVDGERQRLGTDFTNTATGVEFTVAPPVGTGNVAVVYGSATQATYNDTVHDTTKPAAVRGRDVYIAIAPPLPSTSWSDWLGVQSASIDWSVSLERDEEFGNPQVVAQDFDTPEVNGSVTMKPVSVSALFAQIQAIANVTGTDIANATQDPAEMQVRIKITDPADGTTTKTLYVPDAKFVLPSLQGSVGSKLEADFEFTSASGSLDIIKADPA